MRAACRDAALAHVRGLQRGDDRGVLRRMGAGGTAVAPLAQSSVRAARAGLIKPASASRAARFQAGQQGQRAGHLIDRHTFIEQQPGGEAGISGCERNMVATRPAGRCESDRAMSICPPTCTRVAMPMIDSQPFSVCGQSWSSVMRASTIRMIADAGRCRRRWWRRWSSVGAPARGSAHSPHKRRRR